MVTEKNNGRSQKSYNRLLLQSHYHCSAAGIVVYIGRSPQGPGSLVPAAVITE